MIGGIYRRTLIVLQNKLENRGYYTSGPFLSIVLERQGYQPYGPS
jgi:hypothetical protein